jgi:hypothetical protein
MMMDGFSPLAQRLIAAMLAVLALLLAIQLIVLPLAERIAAERQALADARFRVARYQAIINGPALSRVDPALQDQLISAQDARAATQRLAQLLEAGARRQGLIIRTTAVPMETEKAGRAVLVAVEVSGPRPALLLWLAEIESRAPVIRFDQASLVLGDGSAPARLSATARAAWGRGI